MSKKSPLTKSRGVLLVEPAPDIPTASGAWLTQVKGCDRRVAYAWPMDPKPSEAPFHSLSAAEALAALASGQEGLRREEATHRLRRFGPNRLPERRQATLVGILLHQFMSPFIYLLAAAAGLSVFLTHYTDALFIAIVLVVNGAIGGYQEWRAEGQARALRSLIRGTATVIRDGRPQSIEATELVAGDIVTLESGQRVPADLRLIDSEALQVDESQLTGESYPVAKAADEILPPDTGMAERTNSLFSGSLVQSGRGRALVVATGGQTQIGRLASAMQVSAAELPLVRRMRRFTNHLAIAALVLINILIIIELLRGATLGEILLLAIALAVSAIPEGLPVAMTVALSIGVHRMAQRNVIVRHLPAVEGLGACTLIATDKTGTLTLNRLTVKSLWTPLDGRLEPSDSRVKALALAAARCSESHSAGLVDHRGEEIGDAVDLAFLRLATRFDYNAVLELASHRGRIAYEPERRYAADFHGEGDTLVAYVKGAPETVMALCGIDEWNDVQRRKAEDAIRDLAAEGYRVLAVAAGPVAEPGADSLSGLTLLGFAGLIDPLRPEAAASIREAQNAGLRVVMVTGDHPITALAIARQLGLARDMDEVVTGAQLQAASRNPSSFDAMVSRAAVFARSEPLQKLAIVESLQRQGHVVAVTGDGVNDAAALRAADIGVAMGRGGTDVAREAADLILVDDNFASIVSGIEEGRAAYDNLRKVILLCVSTGAAEIALMLLATLTGLPPPLTAVQLLWLNLITNGIQDVALAFEKAEPGLLNRRPRPKDVPIFDQRMIGQVALSAGVMAVVSFAVYVWALHSRQYDLAVAQGLVLWLMVWFENFHTLNCRSETRSLFAIPLRNNRLLIIGVVAAQAIQFAVYAIPALSEMLGLKGLRLSDAWALAVPAMSLFITMEIAKWFGRREQMRKEAAAHSKEIRRQGRIN